MLIIPLAAVASQKLTVLLAGQNCQISVYQKTTGLFLDLAVSNDPIIQCNLCTDRVPMAADEYLGFIGSLQFVDTLGTTEPYYAEFGTRYFLVYE